MASNPPASCCYQGVKHEGEARGTLETLGDFESPGYIRDMSVPRADCLSITDVIGHKFINAQLIADAFADNGYLVLVPDLFYGDPIKLNRPGDFDIMAWLKGAYNEKKQPHEPPQVDPIIDACLVALREQYKVKKIGAVGYCFGGKYVVRHLRPELGKIDAGYTAHPSFVDADELRDVKGPLAIAAAETDDIFPAEKRHETEVILKEAGFPYQINLYSGVTHGFSVRGDLSDPVQKYAKESAFLQAVQWFGEHLK